MKQLLTSEISSVKAATGIAVNSAFIMAVSAFISSKMHYPMADVVLVFSLLSAVPFGIREVIQSKEHWSLRVCYFLWAILVAGWTTFQAARGSAASWDATKTEQVPIGSSLVTAALFPMPSMENLHIYGGYQGNFNPEYRSGGPTGYEALILNKEGNQEWRPSIQKAQNKLAF